MSVMTGMANAAAMTQLVQRDYQNMQLTSPGQQRYNNDALTWGVKAGYINKNEFLSLGNYMNETNRLRGLYEEGGISPQERAVLAQRQKTYDQMYQRYMYGDYHPRTTAQDDIQQRQLNQMGSMYNGLRNGQITMGEGQGLLQEQQGISRLKGNYQQQGSWFNNRLNFAERSSLHNRLNQSGRNIHQAQNNWRTDWNPPFFWPFF